MHRKMTTPSIACADDGYDHLMDKVNDLKRHLSELKQMANATFTIDDVANSLETYAHVESQDAFANLPVSSTIPSASNVRPALQVVNGNPAIINGSFVNSPTGGRMPKATCFKANLSREELLGEVTFVRVVIDTFKWKDGVAASSVSKDEGIHARCFSAQYLFPWLQTSYLDGMRPVSAVARQILPSAMHFNHRWPHSVNMSWPLHNFWAESTLKISLLHKSHSSFATETVGVATISLDQLLIPPFKIDFEQCPVVSNLCGGGATVGYFKLCVSLGSKTAWFADAVAACHPSTPSFAICNSVQLHSGEIGQSIASRYRQIPSASCLGFSPGDGDDQNVRPKQPQPHQAEPSDPVHRKVVTFALDSIKDYGGMSDSPNNTTSTPVKKGLSSFARSGHVVGATPTSNAFASQSFGSSSGHNNAATMTSSSCSRVRFAASPETSDSLASYSQALPRGYESMSELSSALSTPTIVSAAERGYSQLMASPAFGSFGLKLDDSFLAASHPPEISPILPPKAVSLVSTAVQTDWSLVACLDYDVVLRSAKATTNENKQISQNAAEANNVVRSSTAVQTCDLDVCPSSPLREEHRLEQTAQANAFGFNVPIGLCKKQTVGQRLLTHQAALNSQQQAQVAHNSSFIVSSAENASARHHSSSAEGIEDVVDSHLLLTVVGLYDVHLKSDRGYQIACVTNGKELLSSLVYPNPSDARQNELLFNCTFDLPLPDSCSTKNTLLEVDVILRFFAVDKFGSRDLVAFAKVPISSFWSTADTSTTSTCIGNDCFEVFDFSTMSYSGRLKISFKLQLEASIKTTESKNTFERDGSTGFPRQTQESDSQTLHSQRQDCNYFVDEPDDTLSQEESADEEDEKQTSLDRTADIVVKKYLELN